MRLTGFVLSIVLMSVLPWGADAAAPSPTAYDDTDVAQLVRAVLAIPVDHGFLLGLQAVPSAQLPAWDRIAHYAGPVTIPDGRTAYTVLVDDKYSSALTDLGHADHAVGAAIASAVFMAVIDAGRAGTKWKSLYDAAAAADSSLPASVEDRFTNRHALVGPLADERTALYASIAGPDAPAMDQFGLPLTEPIAYGSGLLRCARLGIGAARLIELFEYPGALPQHSTQAYVDGWFSQFGALLPGAALRKDLAALRPLFSVDDSAQLGSREGQFSDGLLALVQRLNEDQLEAFGLGYDANELRYNALEMKSADEDSKLRALVGESGALDGAISGLKELRARLAGLGSADWGAVADVAGQIVAKLTK